MDTLVVIEVIQEAETVGQDADTAETRYDEVQRTANYK
jgi:hypothetical protein